MCRSFPKTGLENQSWNPHSEEPYPKSHFTTSPMKIQGHPAWHTQHHLQSWCQQCRALSLRLDHSFWKLAGATLPVLHCPDSLGSAFFLSSVPMSESHIMCWWEEPIDKCPRALLRVKRSL